VSVDVPFSQASKGANEQFHRAYRAIALEYYKRITMKTPRRTGRAAGNWQIAINESVPGENDRRLPGKLTFSSQEAGKLSKSQVVNFPTITISNPLPYILALEYGSSVQAQNPDGMVRATLSELKGWSAPK
jgi:hypothetical protein